MRKTIQTLNGAVFVAGKGKECANAECEYFGKHYLAYGVLSRDTCKNLQDGLESVAISTFQRFLVAD